MQLELRFL
ncbi:hypothetical protein CGLO_14890 [Colletotrichum gloeosporioides Cg-14]|uniref:Uncharacterized protein n=1 Tax=Colletotrichum gloeosporioides (strain Cg-14) TaxID=1237896 RepID=T0LCP0_COLGC|nr:hypothetical protein CGLO_14890 [Colletotrichum gloeosporioides Cg-14]